jgi:putative ATP-dependent endonuclease of OLD family
MYLKKLQVKNFRCIKDATIDLNEGVNILIGENNSGKTALLDVLRISLSYGKQWRDIYVSLNDFYIDKNDLNAKIGDIEFHLYFETQKEEEAGIYSELLSVVDDKGKKELQLHFRYFTEERKGIRRLKYKVWGGD